MKTLQVALGARSYPIHIGPGLLGRSDLLNAACGGVDVFIVTNETVAPLYLAEVKAALGERRVGVKILPDGESYKTLEVLNTVFDALLEARCSRDCTLLALGGGVVGDIAGFAAATYQRGVGFVQLPTTLLAQVDSSVGGKTGVNHRLGKNMIGAFHQPLCVVADTDTLRTLPDRELRAGLAEVLKYGLISAPAFFDWVEANVSALLARDPEALAYAIGESCRIKAEVVSADEREAGRRALLNLGHTFGHAIEIGMGLGVWLHGEAVGAGLCLAADLSCRLGWLASEDRERIREVSGRIGLPRLAPASIDPDRLRALMQSDKKVAGGKLRLVLLEAIGRAVLTEEFDERALGATLRACREPGAGARA